MAYLGINNATEWTFIGIRFVPAERCSESIDTLARLSYTGMRELNFPKLDPRIKFFERCTTLMWIFYDRFSHVQSKHLRSRHYCTTRQTALQTSKKYSTFDLCHIIKPAVRDECIRFPKSSSLLNFHLPARYTNE